MLRNITEVKIPDPSLVSFAAAKEYTAKPYISCQTVYHLPNRISAPKPCISCQTVYQLANSLSAAKPFISWKTVYQLPNRYQLPNHLSAAKPYISFRRLKLHLGSKLAVCLCSYINHPK